MAKEAEQRQREMMEEAKGGGAGGDGSEEEKTGGGGGGSKKGRGGVAKLVAPVWQETKDLARRAQAMERQEAEKRIAKWEEGNRVLGHTAKSSIARPRELLAISSSARGACIDPPKMKKMRV